MSSPLKFKDSGWTIFDSAVGPVGLAWTPRGVVRVVIGATDERTISDELLAADPDAPRRTRPAAEVGQVIKRLKAQLKGRTDDLTDVPVDLAGVSGFSRKVLRALRKVGPGRTVTYGELAARGGKPGAARAVGRIMGSNPVPLIVPCHRCLGADGSLTGFSSEGGIMLKARLLHGEGVVRNEEHDRGMKTLARLDPVMKKLIKTQAPFSAIGDRDRSGYETLIVAIVHQQLSVKAGQTIAERVRNLTGGPRFPRPLEMLDIPDADLRACGLSNMKVSFVKDLAARVADGRLKLAALSRMDDEKAIARLTEVRGIGRWSAQMHLLFHMGRLDVWAIDDLGLQKGAARLYGLEEPVSKAAMEEVGERWRPYRSIASWYLWRALDAGGV